jgi:hypothetical protein
MKSPIKQAIERLEQNFSSVQDEYWLKHKERGVGAIYLSLDGNLSYLTKPEIEQLPTSVNANTHANRVLKNPKPDWIVVVVEISEFHHERFSWELLAIDEKKRIQIFSRLTLGFRLQGSQTTLFIGEKISFLELQSPEGIESVTFIESGGGQ